MGNFWRFFKAKTHYNPDGITTDQQHSSTEETLLVKTSSPGLSKVHWALCWQSRKTLDDSKTSCL